MNTHAVVAVAFHNQMRQTEEGVRRQSIAAIRQLMGAGYTPTHVEGIPWLDPVFVGRRRVGWKFIGVKLFFHGDRSTPA